jgi:septal ring factor EnvC (AmiA/AmiB activator)
MFEQNPAAGPGLGTVTQHTFEILVLLSGAFLLGLLLHWLLSRSTARQLRQSSIELARTRERLAAAERRPVSAPRLREANSTEHERTLTQLRESREAEARARERIIVLEGQLLSAQAPAADSGELPEVMEAVLPFVTSPSDKSGNSR